MKKSILLFAIVLMVVSCKKESKEPVLPPNVESVSWIGKAEVVVYSKNIITTVTPIDSSKAKVTLTLKSKSIEFLAIKKVVNGITSVDYKSITDSTDYYSIDVNSEGILINSNIVNSLPFDKLGITITPTAFLGCIKQAVRVCKSSWGCKLTFGTSIFGIVSAGIGWSLKCILGY